MRAHWGCSPPFSRYWQEKYKRNPDGSQHDRLRFSHSVTVPGNVMDKKRGFRRFARWHKLPDAAHKLYWRLRKLDA